MSNIILRLRGLDAKARSEDIRVFFEGLNIDRVCIVGGSLGEAFIVFSSERNGQLALRRSGTIKGSKVTLQLSSVAELERRLKSKLEKKTRPPPPQQHSSAKRPRPPSTPEDPPPQDTPRYGYDAEVGASSEIYSAFQRQHSTTNEAANFSCSNCSSEIYSGIQRQFSTTNEAANFSRSNCSSEIYSGIQRQLSTTNEAANFSSSNCSSEIYSGIQRQLSTTNEAANFSSSNCSPEIYSGIQRQLSTTNEAANFSRSNSVVDEYGTTAEVEDLRSRPGYARLFGLPACVTKEDVCSFLKGLQVQEVIVNVMLGPRRGCLVKFAGFQDGHDALVFNQQHLGSFCVEVRGATEKMWMSAVEECEKPSNNSEEMCERPVPSLPTGTENEPHRKRTYTAMDSRRDPLQKSVHGQRSVHTVGPKKRSVVPLQSQKPLSDRASSNRSNRPQTSTEYCVMVSKLPTNMTKTDLRELFQCKNLPNSKILHVLDRTGKTTDTVFIVFHKAEDYEYALNLSGCHVSSRAIAVSATTRKDMEAMLNSEQQPFVYVRNMPADVDRNQINAFFHKYKLRMENIFVMQDGNGNGIGEAVIQFKSETVARLAKSLHGQIFLGSKLLLRSINRKQMQDILETPVKQ